MVLRWNLECLFDKQVIEFDFALDVAAVHVFLYSIRRNECLVQGFAGFGRQTETFCPFTQVFVILPGDFKFALGEFHFTQVDGLVPAVYQQVYLSPFAFPCTDITLHAAYA